MYKIYIKNSDTKSFKLLTILVENMFVIHNKLCIFCILLQLLIYKMLRFHLLAIYYSLQQ